MWENEEVEKAEKFQSEIFSSRIAIECRLYFSVLLAI